MRMGQGVRTGLGHGAITYVLQTLFLSSLLAGKRTIVVTILVRCMCVRPSGFVRTITCIIMH